MNSNYTWTEGPGGPVHHENFDSYKMIYSDTLISDTLFQKLYSCDSDFNINSSSFAGYFKSIGNRVFFGDSSENMKLMYDYNLAVGDTFRFNSFSNPWEQTSYVVKVVSVDTVSINGENRKRITFENFPYDEWNTSIHVVWVEGIGDYNYGLIWDYGLILYCAPTGYSSIKCFSENGNSIIGNCNISTNVNFLSSIENDIEVYPNPFTDILKLDGIDGIFLIKIFNIQGELVFNEKTYIPTEIYLNNLHDGIYFLEIFGKKNMYYRKLIIKYSH